MQDLAKTIQRNREIRAAENLFNAYRQPGDLVGVSSSWQERRCLICGDVVLMWKPCNYEICRGCKA